MRKLDKIVFSLEGNMNFASGVKQANTVTLG
jgi:hypothetical protein